jgi:hypothetical protein
MIMVRWISCIGLLTIIGCSGGSGGSSLAAAPIAALQSATAGDGYAVCDKGTRLAILPKGGQFKVPKCAGWTGTIGYPRNGGWYSWSVTSSTSNAFGAPSPPSGTAIFYMQTVNKSRHLKFAPSFFDGSATATITSPKLTSSHTYTLIVYNLIVDAQCPEPPPSEVAAVF